MMKQRFDSFSYLLQNRIFLFVSAKDASSSEKNSQKTFTVIIKHNLGYGLESTAAVSVFTRSTLKMM